MIFGGINDEYGPNPNYVWWLDGSYLTLQRFHEPMKLVRGYHKTLALDDPITGDFYMYHIGGTEDFYGSTLVEVWRLKWIRDPAFNDGEIYCPDWCNWGMENLFSGRSFLLISNPFWIERHRSIRSVKYPTENENI